MVLDASSDTCIISSTVHVKHLMHQEACTLHGCRIVWRLVHTLEETDPLLRERDRESAVLQSAAICQDSKDEAESHAC